MTSWNFHDIPDQTGRVVVVTGANSGIGLVTAREMARAGAYVVLACRNLEKAERARESIPGGDDHSEARELDLADLDSVRAFAAGLSDWRIDVLVNNAGVMAIPEARTAQGFEMQFGTNVLGHFLLTSLLLDNITDRVVWESSIAHRMGQIELDDLNWERRRYNTWAAYGQSKLGDLMLAYELQRRFVAHGSSLRSMAAHPGYSDTNLQARAQHGELIAKLNAVRFVTQTAKEGALPTLFAATVPDLAGGAYIGPDGFGQLKGSPRPVGSNAKSHDRETARRLWAACEELTGSGPFLD